MKKLLYPALAAILCVSISAGHASGQEGANLIRKRGIAKPVAADSMRVPVTHRMPSAQTPQNRLVETLLRRSDRSNLQQMPFPA